MINVRHVERIRWNEEYNHEIRMETYKQGPLQVETTKHKASIRTQGDIHPDGKTYTRTHLQQTYTKQLRQIERYRDKLNCRLNDTQTRENTRTIDADWNY